MCLKENFKLYTDRLVIRSFEGGDVGAYHEFVGALSGGRANVEQVKDAVRHRLLYTGPSMMFSLLAKEKGQEGIALCIRISPKNAQGYLGLGYETHPQKRGQGLMSEALGAVMDNGFEEGVLGRVNARGFDAMVSQNNVASCRVLKRLGFRADPFFRGDAGWIRMFKGVSFKP